MARLVTHVHLRNPGTDAVEVFGPGSDVPGWAVPLITNPKAWEGGVVPSPASSDAPEPDSGSSEPLEDDAPPPKHGAGSSKQAWAAYAERRGVSVPDGASRDDMISACEQAGVEVE